MSPHGTPLRRRYPCRSQLITVNLDADIRPVVLVEAIRENGRANALLMDVNVVLIFDVFKTGRTATVVVTPCWLRAETPNTPSCLLPPPPTMAESVTPRHSHIYVDVPVLRARPPQMSLAEVSPHAASSTTGSRKTIPLRKASNASKSTSVEAKRAENASSKKKDASVLPLRPSNVTNSTASKKRAREEDEKILRQATGKKRRNVDPPMKQLNKVGPRPFTRPQLC